MKDKLLASIHIDISIKDDKQVVNVATNRWAKTPGVQLDEDLEFAITKALRDIAGLQVVKEVSK